MPAVLIVDDSLTVRMDLAEGFLAAGFAATPCATAAEARAALARERFDIVILDVLLPDADGVAFLRELKDAPATAGIPVMLLSSESEVRDRVRGLTTGADEYVGKPYDAAYVVARARDLVRVAGPPPPPRAAATILLIDDSATFRAELRTALEAAGCAVVEAVTGEEGLRLAADRRPDAVIVDGVLPGIDGATVVRRLGQDAVLRRTPCLLLTASGGSDAELRALDAGADAFVRKDDGVGVILARLTALLRTAGAPAAVEAPASLLGPKRILAVDDSPTYLEALAERLRLEGYETVLARSGEEALELLAAQSVDGILLDLLMPGLSGNETCRRIKDMPARRDIPLLMLTARDDRETMIEGINAGADDFIAKSSDFEVLKARLRAQLRRKQFEDENRRIREQLMRREMEASEARTAAAVAEARAAMLADLERKNAELGSANAELQRAKEATDAAYRELESFSYSVSHDLRAPLRAIDGFGQALAEDCADRLDAAGREHLQRIRAATQRMGQLIDGLLDLARVSRAELRRERVDLSAAAESIAAELRRQDPARRVEFVVAPGLTAEGDARLLQAALQNLLANAWKFTARRPAARIEFGARTESAVPGPPSPVAGAPESSGPRTYYVKDDGAGFDPAHAAKLFGAFQRLHGANEFQGTGIGLATVQRIVHRHGGRAWAEGAVGRGATFFFTLDAGPFPAPPEAPPAPAAADRRT